jgi:hypothetical protein
MRQSAIHDQRSIHGEANSCRRQFMVENLVVLLPEAIVTYFELGRKRWKCPKFTAFLTNKP